MVVLVVFGLWKGNGMPEPNRTDAVAALRERGVNNPEQLLELAAPADILATCHRWDVQAGVSPGLLVRWIKDGNFPEPDPPSTTDRLKAQFAEHQARLPVGTRIIRHADLEAGQWNRDEKCIGVMCVQESDYPVLTLECSVCLFTVGVPVKDLNRVRRHVDPDEAF